MTRSNKGISIGLVVVALLIAWLLFSGDAKAATGAAADGGTADPGRVTKEIEVEADIYNPNFGLTDAQIAERDNPAVDPVMRDLISRSNRLILQDPSDAEAP